MFVQDISFISLKPYKISANSFTTLHHHHYPPHSPASTPTMSHHPHHHLCNPIPVPHGNPLHSIHSRSFFHFGCTAFTSSTSLISKVSSILVHTSFSSSSPPPLKCIHIIIKIIIIKLKGYLGLDNLNSARSHFNVYFEYQMQIPRWTPLHQLSHHLLPSTPVHGDSPHHSCSHRSNSIG